MVIIRGISKVKSECGNGLTWFFGVAASHKQRLDEVADQNDEGN